MENPLRTGVPATIWSKKFQDTKRGVKIALRAFGLFAVLILGLAIAVQTPGVQSYIGRRAVAMLGKRISGDITFGRLHILPFKAIVVEDAVLTDKAPAVSGADTVATVNSLSARFSIKGLFHGEGIHLTDVSIDGGSFLLVTEPPVNGVPSSNIKRIFNSGKPKQEPPKPLSGNIFDASDVKIDGLRFRMINLANPVELPERTINWSDLDISDISLRARKVRMKGSVVSGTVDSLSFREKSGFVAEHLSGTVRNGDGETDIRELRIRTDSTDIYAHRFRMVFGDIKNLSAFEEKVRLYADLGHSLIDLHDIAYFASSLRQMDFRAYVEGEYEGYVNDFAVRNLSFEMNDGKSRMKGTLDGRVTGLPDAGSMLVDASVSKADFSVKELGSFIGGLSAGAAPDFGDIARDQRISLNAKAKGPINRLNVSGKALMYGRRGPSSVADVLTTSANVGGGMVDLDISVRNIMLPQRPVEIGGRIVTSGLDLGRITGSDALGPLSAETVAEVWLTEGMPRLRLDTLAIGSLYFNGYNYKDISAKGFYDGQSLEAALVSANPDLDASFRISYAPDALGRTFYGSFGGKVTRADLHAMNLSSHERAAVSFSAAGSALKEPDGAIRGDMTIGELRLEDAFGIHGIGNINISAIASEHENSIDFMSDFLQGSYSGTRFIDGFVRDLTDATIKRELPDFFGGSKGDGTGNRYSLNLAVADAKDILAFFMPGAYIEKGTSLTLGLDENGILEAYMNSGRIALKDKYLRNIAASFGNGDGSLSGTVSASELSAGAISSKNNRVRLYAGGNKVGIGISYDNESDLQNTGELYLSGELGKTRSGDIILLGQTHNSSLYLNSEPWSIGATGFSLEGKDFHIDSLRLDGISQSISIAGGMSTTKVDTLSVTLDNFDLGMVNAFMPAGLSVRGLASGYARLVSDPDNSSSILMDLGIDSTYIGSSRLGRLAIGSMWNSGTSSFDLNLRNFLDGTYSLMARGSYTPETKGIKGNVYFRDFDIGFAAPMAGSVFSELSGSISGGIRIAGSTAAPDISSEGLRIDGSVMRVAFTNVAYKVSGPLRIAADGVHFENVGLTDRFGGAGVLTGGLRWNNLKDMRLGVGIEFSGMEVLDIPERMSTGFYGNVFGDGSVSIDGPFNSLTLAVDATTVKNGALHIPLSGSASMTSSNLLTFVDFNEKNKKIDPYEEMLGRMAEKKTAGGGGGDLKIRLRVNVNENTAAIIELDKNSGNVATARGNGLIEIDVRPSSDILDFGGRYNITSGNFHVNALGLATKDFRLTDDSYISFNGDIMDSKLEIGAVYRTKAAIGTLIGDESANVRRTVDCRLDITDSPKNPRIDFNIDVPDLEPSTQGLVESALSTQDKIQKQFLSLLISGSFLPDEQSGIVNNANMLNTTVSEIMMGQLNNILQKLDISLDLGLDFQTDAGGRSMYDIAVSTELFNNRVIVNGTIGNRNYSTSSSQNEMFGDLDIEIKLDKAGALRLNLFSHSIDQYSSYLDDSQRNGIGLTFQKDFKSLGDFINGLFKKKSKAAPVNTKEPMKKITIEKE